MSRATSLPRRGWAARLLDHVERIGNRLPDPLTLFVILAAMVPVISWLVAAAGWSVVHPRTGETVTAVNLLTTENIRRMFTGAVTNFTSFPPLGVVLVAMIGIALAERTGLISTLLKMAVMSVPPGLISAAVVFAGLMSHLAADVGYVVLVPLGAVVFMSAGRHPLAGLAAAFAGVAGGFSANPFLTPLDPLLSNLTQEGVNLLDPGYTVEPTGNWWFMAASTFLLTGIGWFVTDKIVEPRLGPWKPGPNWESGTPNAEQGLKSDPVPSSEFPAPSSREGFTAATPAEARGVAAAMIAFLLVIVAVVLLSAPRGALLRDEEGSLKPLHASIVTIMLIAFFVPGLVYGIVTGSVRDDKTVARMTAETMNTMGIYIVLAFAAAQFIAYFNWSNLGTMLAIGGADVLKGIGFGGLPLIITFILVAALLDMFVGSASAKWAVMAPVFVPMLMQLGFSPEMTQAAYRIGDSVVNIITPLMPYFPLAVAFGRKYDSDLGIGTLVALMLPYSVAFLLGWTSLLVVWWVFDIPLGPGAPIHYVPST